MHYRDIGPAVRRQIFAADQMLYASYRMGELVYWTKRPVLVHRGETVLTDGSNLIRGRCGNRLSRIPEEPIRFVEPPSVSGDATVDVQMAADTPEIPSGEAEAPALDADLADMPPGKPSDPNSPPPKPPNSGKMMFAPVPTVFWPQPAQRQPMVVPETSTWVTMLGGLCLIAAIRMRSRRSVSTEAASRGGRRQRRV